MISLTKLSAKLLKSLRKALLTEMLLVCLKFPRTPCQRGKKRGLGSTRDKPEKYEAVNRAVMKWLLNMRSENIPIQ